MRCGLPLALAAAVAAAACAPDRAQFTAPPPAETVDDGSRSAPDAPRGPLDGAAVAARVLAANPTSAASRAAVEVALGDLAAAEAALLPRLSAEASYLLADQPSAYLFRTIDAHALPRGVDFNEPGRIRDAGAALVARWNLWDAGRTKLGAWSADEDAAAADARAAAADNLLVAAALTAWLDVRVAGDLIESDEASVRSVSSQVEETRTKAEGGAALRSDLLSLEVRLAEARERRIRTDLGRRQALAALKALLAYPADTALEVAATPFDPGALPESLAGALVEAFRSRGELAAARSAVTAARMRVEAARRGRLPRVDVEARASSDDGDGDLGFRDPNWSVAIAASFDVFDGGATEAAVRRARGALRAMEEADRHTLLAVGADVEAALLRLEEARARLDVASKAVDAAAETLSLVETQFRGGAATVTRFLEAESARTNARTSHVAARFAVERARIDVARALGRFGTPPAEAVR